MSRFIDSRNSVLKRKPNRNQSCKEYNCRRQQKDSQLPPRSICRLGFRGDSDIMIDRVGHGNTKPGGKNRCQDPTTMCEPKSVRKSNLMTTAKRLKRALSDCRAERLLQKPPGWEIQGLKCSAQSHRKQPKYDNFSSEFETFLSKACVSQMLYYCSSQDLLKPEAAALSISVKAKENPRKVTR